MAVVPGGGARFGGCPGFCVKATRLGSGTGLGLSLSISLSLCVGALARFRIGLSLSFGLVPAALGFFGFCRAPGIGSVSFGAASFGFGLLLLAFSGCAGLVGLALALCFGAGGIGQGLALGCFLPLAEGLGLTLPQPIGFA